MQLVYLVLNYYTPTLSEIYFSLITEFKTQQEKCGCWQCIIIIINTVQNHDQGIEN